MLPDFELEEMRIAALDAMQDTCTIQTPTETNTKGSVLTTYADTYTGVRCRCMPAGKEPRVYVTAGKVTRTTEWVLTVPYDQAIAAGDRVVFGTTTYDVLGVFDDHSYRTARRADLAVAR